MNRRSMYMWIGATFVVLSVLAFVISLSFYIKYVGSDLSTDSQVWGQFGDFMGGFVGTLVSLFTLIALAVTLYLQATVLDETKRSETLKLRPILKSSWDGSSAVIYQSNTTNLSKLEWSIANVGPGAAVLHQVDVAVTGFNFGSHRLSSADETRDIWEQAIAATLGAKKNIYVAPTGIDGVVLGSNERVVLLSVEVPPNAVGVVKEKLARIEATIHFSSMAGERLSTQNQTIGLPT